MAKKVDFSEKLQQYRTDPLFTRLTPREQAGLETMAVQYRFTFQEFREVVEAQRDLSMWGEEDVLQWWETERHRNGSKKDLIAALRSYVDQTKSLPKDYGSKKLVRPKKREKGETAVERSDKNIFGTCPVASEKTVCCNLYTIDAVENCIFGCSYCTIQTFYNDRVVFDADFHAKLKSLQLDPDRFYHIGTGQSSDSLAWGNKNGNLDALCEFATDHPNVLLELKTKSDNVRYFQENEIPKNIVCSWLMNTPVIIENEEHFTANLDRRIGAARSVANRGIRVAFHFHPMVWYGGWEEDYPSVARRLIDTFDTEEVSFLSFGSVTMIKPAMKKIRDLGHPTRILQMPFVKDPHGKYTYPDEIKVRMFKTMYEVFEPWREDVFQYLCMEKALIWEEAFGCVYESNEVFEKEFGRWTFGWVGF